MFNIIQINTKKRNLTQNNKLKTQSSFLFGYFQILIFLCNINSIRKKDCLNYKEELRDGLCETPTTSVILKGAKTRPEKIRNYNLNL